MYVMLNLLQIGFYVVESDKMFFITEINSSFCSFFLKNQVGFKKNKPRHYHCNLIVITHCDVLCHAPTEHLHYC